MIIIMILYNYKEKILNTNPTDMILSQLYNISHGILILLD